MSPDAVLPLELRTMTESPVAGLRVVERMVEGATATVIAIHGGLDRGGSFARLARRLRTLNLIAYDRRGYQGSRDLGPLSLDENLSDLQQLAKYASQRGPVIYFGHSYGGLLALTSAAAEPELVQLVVTYEPALPWSYRRQRPKREFSLDPAQEAENFFRRIVSNAVWERLSAQEKESRRLDGPALLNDLQTLRDSPLLQLQRIEAPTVYIYGDGPNKSNYEEVAQRLSHEIQDFTIVQIDRAPHGAHLANPDKLASIIEQQWENT